MVGLGELENMQLAQQLIRARLRLSVIRALTDVSTLTLRQWWHDIHGVRAGQWKAPRDRAVLHQGCGDGGPHLFLCGVLQAAQWDNHCAGLVAEHMDGVSADLW